MKIYTEKFVVLSKLGSFIIFGSDDKTIDIGNLMNTI